MILEEIFNKLLKKNWLVHNFNDVDNTYVFDLQDYLRNKHQSGVSYTVFLDLNIYKYTLNAYKKGSPKDEFRDAIALVAAD